MNRKSHAARWMTGKCALSTKGLERLRLIPQADRENAFLTPSTDFNDRRVVSLKKSVTNAPIEMVREKRRLKTSA